MFLLDIAISKPLYLQNVIINDINNKMLQMKKVKQRYSQMNKEKKRSKKSKESLIL